VNTVLDQRVELGTGPTPCIDAGALHPGLWFKDDGAFAPLYGGNKPRKLEYLLHDAPTQIATMGAKGSHHALATAVHGVAEGHVVDVVTFPRPFNAHVQQIHAATAARATMHTARDLNEARRVLGQLEQGGARCIPAGGSSARGALGFVRAGRELVEQVQAGCLPAPRRIYVAMGTAGTVVGLALAMHEAGMDAEVIGVRVVPEAWLTLDDVHQLAQETASLGGLSMAMPRIVDDWLGAGYGESTPAAECAVKAASQVAPLEATYTGKALAAALDESGDGPILFWQTHNTQSIAPLLQGLPLSEAGNWA
jgi:D-cysteine desulfhydrase